MKVIIDTNILFSALLASEDKYSRVLFTEDIDVFATNYLFVELFTHQPKILKYTHLTKDEALEKLQLRLKKIHFLNENYIGTKALAEAYEFCKDIDPKDVLHVALAIELDAKLWTSDKKLKEGLLAKGFNNFYE